MDRLAGLAFLIMGCIVSTPVAYAVPPVLSFRTFDSPVIVDFTGFDGSGCMPTPPGGGLDSNNFAISGFSDGVLGFYETQTGGDFARGNSQGNVSIGGLYAFEVSPLNQALGVQPTDDDFTPGTITLRVHNAAGSTIGRIELSLSVYVYNDGWHSAHIVVEYSTDGMSYFPAGFTFDTDFDPEEAPSWQRIPYSDVISGLSLASGSFFFLRFRVEDGGGVDQHDELAFDDIHLTPLSAPVDAAMDAASVDASDDMGADLSTDDVVIDREGSSDSGSTDVLEESFSEGYSYPPALPRSESGCGCTAPGLRDMDAPSAWILLAFLAWSQSNRVRRRVRACTRWR